MKKNVTIHVQELNTILAALRYYQHCGMGEPSNRPDWLHDIATDCDNQISMVDEDIDQLCLKLNGVVTEDGTRSSGAGEIPSA